MHNVRHYLLSQVKDFCYTVKWSGEDFDLVPGGTPGNTDSGESQAIYLDWENSGKGRVHGDITEDGELINRIWFSVKISPKYSCTVNFVGREIKIEQDFRVRLEIDFENDWNGSMNMDFFPAWYARSDKYEMSVDQNGGLVFTNVYQDAHNRSQGLPSHDYFDIVWAVIGLMTDQLAKKIKTELRGQLEEMQLNPLQQFVFPGAKVFTYKNPSFSQHQDLICDVTYLDPIGTESTGQPKEASSAAVTTAIPSSQQKQNASGGRLTASTELIRNYVHGEIVSPTGNFEALQSGDGHGLLFSIDSAGVFHVFEEQSGSSHTGWQVHDLSTAAIAAQFHDRAGDAKVRTFGVGQSAKDETIGLMMAVDLDGEDYLFISLNNSNTQTSWNGALDWAYLPFDAVNEESQKISIVGTLFAETPRDQCKQRLVVDIQRLSGGNTDPHITRYHVDKSKKTGHYWVKHDVTVDISTDKYHSCVGQVKGGLVDGIYTAGTTGGSAQLVYEPIENINGDGPPPPRRLHLPGNGIPSAIATSRNPDLTTDLYVVSGSTLYRFPADKQRGDKDEPILLVTNDLLNDTDTLHSMNHEGVITIWGRNTKYQVYYISCPTDKVGQADAWSAAVPILSGVERISPYLNRTDGGNTIFAAGNGRLRKLMQGSAESGRKWRAQEITLAVPPEQKSHDYMSYTTSIHVTQSDLTSPAANALLSLSANDRTPVHINGLYYVLSTTPIQVSTDAMGAMTVVEASEGINGTVITISLDDENTVSINPMDKNVNKITALNASDKVRGAQVTHPTVPGGIIGSPNTTPLVAPSTSDDDVDRVAKHLNLMKESYAKAKDSQTTSAVQVFIRQNHGVIPATLFQSGKIPTSKLGLFDGIAAAAGDLFNWLESAAEDLAHAVEHVAQVIYDDVSDSLHFLATIGGQVFRAVLDTVDAVVGAVKWVFDAIKTGIEDLIHFLEFLFEWDDISRTKDVMHNITKLWLQDQVDNIPRAQGAIDGVIADAEKKINQWAGITDWAPVLGDVANTPASSSGSDPNKKQTSGSKLLSDKYRDHSSQLQILGDSPSGDVVEDLLNDLIAAVSGQEHVLEDVMAKLQDIANQFSSLSVDAILKKLAAILVDGLLSSMQVVVDALLKVLYQLAQSALKVLDTKIHIPVISDILNAIGVHDISTLDLFTWIGAVAVTLVYKFAEGHAPFLGNDDSVKSIISAGSWDELAGLFGQQSTAALFSSPHDASVAPTEQPKLISMSQSTKHGIFVGCNLFSGILLVLGNTVLASEAEDQTGSLVLGIPATVIGLTCAAVGGAGNFLVSLDPIENPGFKALSAITTTAVIGCKVVFSGLGQWAFKKLKINKLVVEDSRGVGAFLNGVLVIHGTVATLWHFVELVQEPANDARSAAIFGEVANVSSYVSRVAYAFAVNDKESESRTFTVALMCLANYAAGGFQSAQADYGSKALS